ncbi:cyclic nucleotide-binding domain-containing protein [Haematococcus lacustris]|uniref:Cyclic nucleotide-binding domain-containing protein n=1 Tax=Haematococcus lacustris TaxID=44745 RepID=A0A699Z6A3_HAELA|nr:cyclic nucleotide-binding domain-containing protein [Haematococcus lacustris]
MDEDFRLEVCRLVEYLHCPEGFVLFEEGDKIDFCYVVLQGKVVFNKYNDKARRQDEIGTKSTGEHFGTLLTLSSGEKKRPFTAITASRCEMAIISRVGYNRILKKQLQGAISARISLLQSLNVMNANSYQALQRVVGEHFGTLLTLSSGEKKRPFTAITASRCEMAIISRVGYNRILKKQLQGAISARISLLQSLNVMNANSYQALQRVAINCQDETFHAGATIVEPANYPNKLFVIMEGEAKLTYVTEYPNQMPLDTMASTHAQVKQPTAAELMAPDPPTATKRHDHAATGGRVSMGGGRAGGARNRDALATAQQLEGGTHRGAASQGLRLAGTRRKVVIEVARLSKGDVFNGVTLFGKAPVFSVVACTPMRLVSLEADSVEGFVGREATRALKSLVSQSHSWAMQRLAQMLSVRQTVDACIMDPATHRVMHANAQRNFMEHYVPSGVTEMLASAAEQRQQHQPHR